MKSPAATTEKSSPSSTQLSNQSAPQPAQFVSITYRGHNGYDQKAASDQATLPADQYGESLTVQAHAEDADINVLMRRYGITGKMPDNPRIPTYGDFLEVRDFRSALEAVREAQESFMEIPAEVRARFDNDPQLFLEFCSNEANKDEMSKLGLLRPGQPAPELSHDTKAIIDALKPASAAAPPASPGATKPSPST